MITRAESDEQEKKRVLRKVRPRYLSKKGENNNTVALLPKSVNLLSTHMINGAWGLIEKDRKICFGIRYLNNLFSINNVQIQEHLNLKTVVLKGQKFDDLFVVPWEYSVKRLESYGDLELATWAKKIEMFNSNAPKVIEDYHYMLETADQETIMNLKRIQSEVRKYKAKLEASYPYKVVSVLHNKNGVNLSSITFSEAMLQEVGLTPEGFASWAKVNGIPSLFDGHSEFHLNIGKGLLQQSVPLVGGIDVGPEIETFIYDMKGSKRKIVAQHIRVCEPMLNGVLSSGYVIIKSTKLYQESIEEDEILGDLSEHGVKCIKLEGEEETNMNVI